MCDPAGEFASWHREVQFTRRPRAAVGPAQKQAALPFNRQLQRASSVISISRTQPNTFMTSIAHPVTNALLITDVRQPDGARVDVSIADGRIAAIGADLPREPRVAIEDGAGALLLPGFVEGHTHLDKTNWGMNWYRNEVGPKLTDRIENERRWRAQSGHDAGAQSLALARAFLCAGTTRLRTHVDIDTDAGLRHLEGVLATRDSLRDVLDMQIVAFPQSGLLGRPGTDALLDRALGAGADVLGALDPALIDGDPVASLNLTFSLAQRHQKPIDIHLHEPGEIGAFTLGLLLDRVAALGMQGHVVVSHAFCLGALPERERDALLTRLADLRVALRVIDRAAFGTRAAAQALHRTRRDAVRRQRWHSRYVDALRLAGHARTRDADRDALRPASGRRPGARVRLRQRHCAPAPWLRILTDYGLQAGARADLVLVEADTLAHAIVARPPRKLVMANGRIVARNGAPSAISTHMSKQHRGPLHNGHARCRERTVGA